jgi:hypothetical protein
MTLFTGAIDAGGLVSDILERAGKDYRAGISTAYIRSLMYLEGDILPAIELEALILKHL